MSLLPPDEDLELIHTRVYETRVYRLDGSTMLARAVVSDVKPPDLYIAGDDQPLEIHQMHLFLKVTLPELEIIDAGVELETFPHSGCPTIAVHYQKLIGLNVARGFTRKVRELFGGPRGCAHTTALIQAMAPAVLQAIWSMSLKEGPSLKEEPSLTDSAPSTTADVAAAHEARMAGNVNTCHVWDEDGTHVEIIRNGGPVETMIPVAVRLTQLGRSEDEWRDRFMAD